MNPDIDEDEFINIKLVIGTFQDGIVQIRRALANIPTYMIFDDHEITDDWYLHLKWTSKVLDSPLGSRIIQNGLTAYNIFQAWGNSPERYETGNGKQLLDNLELWTETGYEKTVDGEALWETIKKLVGVPTSAQILEDREIIKDPSASIVYSYSIVWHNHALLVLDTRTQRAFPGWGKRNYPALISEVGMESQIASLSTVEVIFLVSGATVTDIQMAKAFQSVLNDKFFVGKKKFDGEAWEFCEDAFFRLFGKLAKNAPWIGETRKARIVILSGDVHYEYAQRIEYWAKFPYGEDIGNNCNIVLVQMTSSSMKNEDFKTSLFHNTGYLPAPSSIPNAYKFGGWSPIPRTIGYLFGIMPLYATNPWMNIGRLEFNNSEVEFTISPDWQLRVDHIVDNSNFPRPFGVIEPYFLLVPPGLDRQEALATYLKMAKNHTDYSRKWGNGKEIVGKNNIGEIVFEWGPNEEDKKVIQYLWWRLFSNRDNNELLSPFPLTKFIVPMGFGLSEFPKPIDIE